MIDLTAIRLKVRKQFDDFGACPMWQEIDALCSEVEQLRMTSVDGLRDRILTLECQLQGAKEHNRRLERERNAAEDALTASKSQGAL